MPTKIALLISWYFFYLPSISKEINKFSHFLSFFAYVNYLSLRCVYSLNAINNPLQPPCKLFSSRRRTRRVLETWIHVDGFRCKRRRQGWRGVVTVRNQICILSRDRSRTRRRAASPPPARKLAHLGQFIFSVASAGLTSSCRTNNYSSLSPSVSPYLHGNREILPCELMN